MSYNILEVYEADLTGRSVNLKKDSKTYLIDRTSETWDSLDEWCQEVIWYGNKKGDYFNRYSQIK